MSTSHRFSTLLTTAGLSIILAGVTLAGCAAPQPASTAPATDDHTTNPTAPPAPTFVPTPAPSTGHGSAMLLYVTKEGDTSANLWGANADGSGAHQLVPAPVQRFAVRPTPDANGQIEVAYISSAGDQGVANLAINLLTLPDGQTKQLAPLTSDTNGYKPNDDLSAAFGSVYEISNGLTAPWNMSWSPDGRWLAFGSAADGQAISIHIYDPQSGQIRQMPPIEGGDNAAYMTWSQDSQYVLYSAVKCFSCWQEPSRGLWAVRPDDASVIPLEASKPQLGADWIVEVAPGQFLVGHKEMEATSNLRIVMLPGGASRLIVPGTSQNFWLRYLTLDPADRVLLGYHTDRGDPGKQGDFTQAGWYLVDLNGKPTFVSDAHDAYAEWDRETGAFVVSAVFDDPFAVTLSGEIVDPPDYRIIPSPDGTMNVQTPYLQYFMSGIQLSVGSDTVEVVSELSPGPVVGWSADSKSVFIGNDAGLRLFYAPNWFDEAQVSTTQAVTYDRESRENSPPTWIWIP